MTFKKGNIPWNKGRPWTDAEREKISLGIREPPEPRLCACGCEQLARPGNKWIHGHNLRVNNPMDNPKTVEKLMITNRGRHYSSSTEFKKGNIPWWIERGLPHPTSDPFVVNKIREARLKQVFPKEDTIIEKILQEALTKHDIKFETHYPVLGQPDIVLDGKVAVFADGCYWHGCPECGYDAPDLRVKDEKITSQLEAEGWMVLRLWGHEIEGDIEGCVERIGGCVERI